jgi:uncharacterized protein
MSTQFPDARLIIFAKAPEPGQVKTRLIPALGMEGAADLYREMLGQKLQMLSGNRIARTDLYCSPDRRHPFFQQAASSYDLELHSQTGNDLGERMSNALQKTLENNTLAVIIGSDCPPLDLAYLHSAFHALEQGAEAVIGPATDGGYVLLGLRRFEPAIFTDIAWGTDSVLARTRDRLQMLGFSWVELDTLWDLDRPEDLLLHREQLSTYLEPGSRAPWGRTTVLTPG